MIRVFFLLLFASQMGHAFPEMVRHGYVNCTTCHISPSGGGVLTSYGRGLSREILSTWGTEKEARPYYMVDSPDWLHLGGDVRWIQTYKNTPTYREGRFILMQADLEAGMTHGRFKAVATLGRSDVNGPKNVSEFFTSHRHYLMYNPTEEFTIRGGRFYPAFGLNPPDHTLATRRGLGWDQGGESYNLEASYIGEKYDAFVTGIFGRPDKPAYKKETGFAVRGSASFAESYKVGLSYYYGSNDLGTHHYVGPYTILGFSPRCFLLLENDLKRTTPKNRDGKWGLAHYARLDYEVYQGVHVFLTEDISRTDFKSPLTNVNSFGGGVQLFPRPHFDITAQYQKMKISAIDDQNYNDFFWFLMHFYP